MTLSMEAPGPGLGAMILGMKLQDTEVSRERMFKASRCAFFVFVALHRLGMRHMFVTY